MSDLPRPKYDIAPRPLSRLSYQIMGLNLMALLILIVGVFYLDQYKKDLTASETELLATEAQLYSSILSDNTLNNGTLDIPKAEKVLRTFGHEKTQRLRLFSHDGKLLVDTGLSFKTNEAADNQLFSGVLGGLSDVVFSSVGNIFAINFDLPFYPETSDSDFRTFPGVDEALSGNSVLSAWRSKEGGLLLSTALPVKKDGKNAAILFVTRADTRIEQSFAVMRIGLLKFFLGSLIVTLLFSLYLSAIIGHPLRKLASAAIAVRENRDFEVIPDLSYRNDEIGELSIALREMAQDLQERIESIERFAADVSHELKNPLTSLRSAVETLDKVKRDEDRNKLMGIVMHDLVRMDRLISDISRASRLDAELLREILEPIDLRDVILPLIDIYKTPIDRADENNRTGNVQCFGLTNPVMVLGHAPRLTQIFENLISNAISFSPKDRPVMISIEISPGLVTVAIDDFGPGIPENRLEKVFERFYTERPDGESFGSHSGLGLSIVKQIVDAHEGTVEAQNRLDRDGKVQGARFIVRLRAA